MDWENTRGSSIGPKNKKRPLTLSSLGTPEQPSPRTAQAQDIAAQGLCIFHLRARAWHHAATRSSLRIQTMAAVRLARFAEWIVSLWTQSLYTSMQRFALRIWNSVVCRLGKVLIFNSFTCHLLWKQTCTLTVGSIYQFAVVAGSVVLGGSL
jgi:hypothetical protein